MCIRDRGGTLCESSVIPFLVPRRKVSLTPAAGVPFSNAANIGECKTWTQSEVWTRQNYVTGKSSPGDGQTSCKVWLASGERRRCGNEAKTRNPLKFSRVPKLASRSQPLVGRSSPCSGGHLEEILLLNKFFPIAHHRRTLSGYVFGTKACIDNRKNLLNSST